MNLRFSISIILAWLISIMAQAKPIIVAIIDTGIDTDSAKLAPYLWRNNAEIPNNGIDDDHNGWIDDLHGWNFSTDNNILKDQHGHGTHIAGLVTSCATPDEIKIMILKYYSDSSSNLKASENSIKYAIRMGAQVINYSGGGPDSSPTEQSLIKQALEKNITVIAAAGNESQDLVLAPFFPANYDLPNIISVGAFNQKGLWLKYSNFNQRAVDIAAQGEKVISTLPNNKLGPMTGTSQATARVSCEYAKFLSSSNTQNILINKHQFLAQQPRSANFLGKVKWGRFLVSVNKNLASKD